MRSWHAVDRCRRVQPNEPLVHFRVEPDAVSSHCYLSCFYAVLDERLTLRISSMWIRGSDLRNISNTTLTIIGNAEALAVNRDSLGAHGRLVYDHTGSVAAPEAVAIVPAPVLSCTVGALSPGEFLRVANLTIAQAVEWCTSQKGCGGFTTRATACDTPAGGENSTQNHECYFKTDITGHNIDPLWRTWRKPHYEPPPPPARFQVFAKPLADGSRAVVLLNRGPTAIDANVTWQHVQLGNGPQWKRAKVRDLWAHKDLGVFTDSFTFKNLQSHAAAFLIVTNEPAAN